MNVFLSKNFNRLAISLENGSLNKEYKDILENSLFYYCSGKDTTPISSLKDKYSMFIYADIINYGRGDFEKELTTFYERLKNDNLYLEKNIKINFCEKFKNAELSVWKTINNGYFLLLFIQGDATKVYQHIYENNNITSTPKCICNIKYEMNTQYFLKIEKNVDYILGNCYNHNFILIDSFDYKGDYNVPNKKVNLYKNSYYNED